MNNDIIKLLCELSFMSRETAGASFNIQHVKESGKWKVVFPNAMLMSKAKMKETDDFEQALKDAILWLRDNRKLKDIPEEKYSIF